MPRKYARGKTPNLFGDNGLPAVPGRLSDEEYALMSAELYASPLLTHRDGETGVPVKWRRRREAYVRRKKGGEF